MSEIPPCIGVGFASGILVGRCIVAHHNPAWGLNFFKRTTAAILAANQFDDTSTSPHWPDLFLPLFFPQRTSSSTTQRNMEPRRKPLLPRKSPNRRQLR